MNTPHLLFNKMFSCKSHKELFLIECKDTMQSLPKFSTGLLINDLSHITSRLSISSVCTKGPVVVLTRQPPF